MPGEKRSEFVRAEGAEKKVTTPTKAQIYLEYGDKQINIKEIQETARKSYWAREGRRAVRDCKIYLKPEESAAYYVINGVDGRIDL